MKKADKKRPMLLSTAARLLEDEHPEIAFSATQLRDMCSRRAIKCLVLPACGLERRIRHKVHYPSLVEQLYSFYQDAIR